MGLTDFASRTSTYAGQQFILWDPEMEHITIIIIIILRRLMKALKNHSCTQRVQRRLLNTAV